VTRDPVAELQRWVRQYGTAKAAADALGLSSSYMNDLLHRRRRCSDSVLAKLGLQRVERVIEVRPR